MHKLNISKAVFRLISNHFGSRRTLQQQDVLTMHKYDKIVLE